MSEGYRWYHSVNPDWIKARREVFTATELRSLIPAYKRWLKKDDPDAIDPDFCALVAEKLSTGSYDTNTFSWAARGHIMEPYAVEEFNKIVGTFLCHWDDCIIMDKERHVGFSPDALSISQSDWKVPKVSAEVLNGLHEHEFHTILEIKCYAPAKHMKAIFSDPKDLDERYQIAVAMLTCPWIQRGFLVFYNPTLNFDDDTSGAVHICSYGRKELEEEIQLMDDILQLAVKHIRYVKERCTVKCMLKHSIYTEDEIYQEWIAEETNIDVIK